MSLDSGTKLAGSEPTGSTGWESRLPGGGGEEAGPIRRILLALVLFGAGGLSLDLFLLEHTESLWQWIPLVILGGAFASGVAVAVRPARRTLRIFQAVMILSVVAGMLGLYLHFRGNAAFEREMDPAVRGLALFWDSLRGATPALAPGAMVQLGLLGLTYVYRHPALRRVPSLTLSGTRGAGHRLEETP